MNCNICMEKIKNEFVMTNCKCRNIIYHKKCIEKWFNISKNERPLLFLCVLIEFRQVCTVNPGT